MIVKCGNGNNTSPDSSFTINAKGARDAGLYVGAYHVVFPLPADPAHPGRSPKEQAEAHFQQSGGLGFGGGEMPPAMDLEWPVPGSPEWHKFNLNAAFVREWALAYLDRLKALVGVAPLVYDGFPDYINDKGIDAAQSPEFANYPLWTVQYPNKYQHVYPTDTSWLSVPKPWTEARFVQFSGGGIPMHADKGTAMVDGDIFLGSEDDLKEFCSK